MSCKATLIGILAALTVSFPVHAQDLGRSRFAFQDLFLNSKLADVPRRFVEDCSPGKSGTSLCFASSVVGEREFVVISFVVLDRVKIISVAFPRSDYEPVLDALTTKYGRPSSQTASDTQWTFRPAPSAKRLDGARLSRSFDDQGIRDGKYLKSGVEYAQLQYYVSTDETESELATRLSKPAPLWQQF